MLKFEQGMHCLTQHICLDIEGMCIVSLIVLYKMFLLEHKQEGVMIYKVYPTSEYIHKYEVSVLITLAGLSVIILRHFRIVTWIHHQAITTSIRKLKHSEKSTFVVVYNCLVIAFKNAWHMNEKGEQG